MPENDRNLFYEYLNKATIYFEYGSGGSTYQASIRKNIKKIYSVESDIAWHNKLKQIIKTPNVKYIYNEMCSRPNNWGNPGKNATKEQKINYSNQILNLTKEEQDNIDIILIDGRFRVACCLKCFDIINDNCVIIFDDFLNRKYYHTVSNYFDVVNKTNNNKMAVLKKKNNISIPKEVISKFELIVMCGLNPFVYLYHS